MRTPCGQEEKTEAAGEIRPNPYGCELLDFFQRRKWDK